MIRVAMQELEATVCPDYGIHMLLQIHDSVLFEIPVEHDTPEVHLAIRKVMERGPGDIFMRTWGNGPDTIECTPRVDMKVGQTWGKAKAIDFNDNSRYPVEQAMNPHGDPEWHGNREGRVVI